MRLASRRDGHYVNAMALLTAARAPVRLNKRSLASRLTSDAGNGVRSRIAMTTSKSASAATAAASLAKGSRKKTT